MILVKGALITCRTIVEAFIHIIINPGRDAFNTCGGLLPSESHLDLASEGLSTKTLLGRERESEQTPRPAASWLRLASGSLTQE